MLDEKRLTILTNGAKYDVSCSSSGSGRKFKSGELGNACLSGICHSFTPDGRCVSLLKILMSNDCVYDCAYCVNRRSLDAPRATAFPDEICELVMQFYKRNYIEGLFLSSAVVKSPDYTMELLFETVRKLRVVYRFNGYIHVKGIPFADRLLVERTAFYADRMSFNIELPSEKSLKLLAPQKEKNAIIAPMKMLAAERYGEFRGNKNFLPAGQTSQMIIGASPESDAHILRLTEYMYKNYRLKRIYYSSYIPTNPDNPYLPLNPVPKIREHRLYQADWLLRFYGFTAEEITDGDGNLPLDCDPKSVWALKHADLFPVEINSASFAMLVRVPGIGVRSATRIVAARKYAKLGFDDLKRMRVALKRAKHFITCGGKFTGTEGESVKDFLIEPQYAANGQISMFDERFSDRQLYAGGQLYADGQLYAGERPSLYGYAPSPAVSALTGEL